MEKKTFDRTAEDLGNIVNLGHVNLNITDQRIATHFYITGLGLTRDPYLNTGVRIMWVNVGMSQFHLPTSEFPNVLRGTMGLVIPIRKPCSSGSRVSASICRIRSFSSARPTTASM